MKQIVLSLLLAMICIGNAFASSDNILPNWALGGFVRADGVNPIVKPNDQTTFKCPMKQTTVKWECADTFNPAAVYKLRGKGSLIEGFDADIVLVDADTFDIDTVIAKGRIMIRGREVIVKGTFE